MAGVMRLRESGLAGRPSQTGVRALYRRCRCPLCGQECACRFVRWVDSAQEWVCGSCEGRFVEAVWVRRNGRGERDKVAF